MSVTPKDIIDEIITVLEEAAGLTTIKQVMKGEPPLNRVIDYPYCWVEWINGAQTPETTSNRMQVHDVFYVVVVDRHPNADTAEDAIMDFVEAIETALNADRTINGKVAYSYVSNREKEKQFSSDYSIVAARITLTTFRRKTS